MTEAQNKSEHIKTIRELLGMEGEDFPMPEHGPISPSGPAPALNLPVAGIEQELAEAEASEKKATEPHEPEATEFTAAEAAKSKVAKFLSRDFVRYPLIFIVALGFFYLVLNFPAISQQFFGAVNPPETNDEVVLGHEAADYQTWIARYYVAASDPNVTAANADPDGDGLTNMDEFHLMTNPLRRDTDRDGDDDGREVLAGSNPLYGGALPSDLRQIVSEKIDRSEVESRRSYRSSSAVGGENTRGDFFVLDTARPGEISIPRLSIILPVIWSAAFDSMEDDLKNGAAHHPETPYPGEFGTASIHGHSSGNFDDGSFKTAFTKINLLEPGDEVFATVYALSGESRKYRFLVRSKKVYSKTDPKQFNAGEGYFLNLSTSWPIGTSRERYVVTTELAGL